MSNTVFNKRITYLTVSKIENGFTIAVNYEWIEAGNDRWDTKTHYCESLDQVQTKLEEIYK